MQFFLTICTNYLIIVLFSELNTLRFFFNLGVENYRSISQGVPAWQTMGAPPALVAPGAMMTADQMNGNFLGMIPAASHMQPPPGIYGNLPSLPAPQHTSPAPKPTGEPGSNLSSPGKSEMSTTSSRDEMGESNDSGCDTESTSSHPGDGGHDNQEAPAAMELDVQPDTSSHYNNGFLEPAKPRQKKRKFFMYKDMKLVKPIKEIPSRYLNLLSQLSEEKSRCEGEPIIIPFLPPRRYNNNKHVPHPNNATYHRNASNVFNPKAECFVPTGTSTVFHDPSIIACSVATKPSTCPPPVMSHSGTIHPANVSYSQANTGAAHSTPTQSTACNPGNSCYGDGNNNPSMPYCFSAGAPGPYPAGMQYPVYYSMGVPYTGGYMPPGVGGFYPPGQPQPLQQVQPLQ